MFWSFLCSFLRYAKHYLEDGVETRTLLKVFGIRIDIIVHALVGKINYYYFRFLTIYVFNEWVICASQARKFDIIPTLTAIGSGVGIFGVVCDWTSTMMHRLQNNPKAVHSSSSFFFQATVVCDLVLLYLLPKREFYKNMKFKYTDTQAQVRPAEWFCCNITASTGGQQRVWGVRAKAGTDLLSAVQIFIRPALLPVMGGLVGLSCRFNNGQKQLQPACSPNTHPIAVSADRSYKTITKQF